jgi:predicted dehydrogenase
MEREGSSDLIIKFTSGATGYHFGTWGARASRMGYSIHAHGERGLLEANLTEGRIYAHRGWSGTPPRGGLSGTLLPAVDDADILVSAEPNSKHLGGELIHFIECVESGQAPLTDGPGSLQGLRVIWRLYDAEQRGVIADLAGLGLDEYSERT